MRPLAVTSAADLTRYNVVQLRVDWAQPRVFRGGIDATPLTKPAKPLSNEELAKLVAVPAGLLDETHAKQLHPTVPGVFEFWGSPDLIKQLNLKVGDAVEVKTDGNSCFVFHAMKTSEDAIFAAREGGALLAQVSKASSVAAATRPQDAVANRQGCADSEWDDSFLSFVAVVSCATPR